MPFWGRPTQLYVLPLAFGFIVPLYVFIWLQKGVAIVAVRLLPSLFSLPSQSMRSHSLASSVCLSVFTYNSVCLNYLLDIFCDSFRPWEICILWWLLCRSWSEAYGHSVRSGHINYEHFCWPMNLIRMKANTLSQLVCSANRFTLCRNLLHTSERRQKIQIDFWEIYAKSEFNIEWIKANGIIYDLLVVFFNENCGNEWVYVCENFHENTNVNFHRTVEQLICRSLFANIELLIHWPYYLHI